MSPARPDGLSTEAAVDEAVRVAVRVDLDVTREVRRDYASLTGTPGHPAPTGLWVALARLAMGAVLDVPPGGVLLSVSCDPTAPPVASRVTVVVGCRSRATRDGRRVVTVGCEVAGSATVSFVLLLSSDPRSRPSIDVPAAIGTPPAPAVEPLGDEPVSIGIEATRCWSRLTGDRNPLHTDEAYARDSAFGVPIVHGHYLAAILGDWVERRAGAVSSWTCDFLAPVPVGAPVRVAEDASGSEGRAVLSCNGSTAVRVAAARPREAVQR